MSHYIVIESGDSQHPDVVGSGVRTATDLAATGNEVTLFLLQNGVFLARRGARGDCIEAVQSANISVLADDFSLRERGIGADRLSPQVSPSPLEAIIDWLAAGSKVIWH